MVEYLEVNNGKFPALLLICIIISLTRPLAHTTALEVYATTRLAGHLAHLYCIMNHLCQVLMAVMKRMTDPLNIAVAVSLQILVVHHTPIQLVLPRVSRISQGEAAKAVVVRSSGELLQRELDCQRQL